MPYDHQTHETDSSPKNGHNIDEISDISSDNPNTDNLETKSEKKASTHPYILFYDDQKPKVTLH